MLVICEVPIDTRTIDSTAAAAVTTPPLRCSPCTTASVLSPVRSYSSLMRESTKTS